jgi:hypothetical protein
MDAQRTEGGDSSSSSANKPQETDSYERGANYDLMDNTEEYVFEIHESSSYTDDSMHGPFVDETADHVIIQGNVGVTRHPKTHPSPSINLNESDEECIIDRANCSDEHKNTSYSDPDFGDENEEFDLNQKPVAFDKFRFKLRCGRPRTLSECLLAVLASVAIFFIVLSFVLLFYDLIHD